MAAVKLAWWAWWSKPRWRPAATRTLDALFEVLTLQQLKVIDWSNQRKGTNTKPPTKADIGYRSPSALCATGDTIVIPADSPGPVQYED